MFFVEIVTKYYNNFHTILQYESILEKKTSAILKCSGFDKLYTGKYIFRHHIKNATAQ